MDELQSPEVRARHPGFFADEHMMEEGRLSSVEHFWRDHYFWLKESGYVLRPRYVPGWSAPWKGTKQYPRKFEESVMSPVRAIYYNRPFSLFLTFRTQSADVMDATRTSDGSYVVLKKTNPLDRSRLFGQMNETHIFQKVSSEPLASDPTNHCIRLVEVLRVPDEESDLIVMPLLVQWDEYPFETIGEAVDFFSQIFEVSVFHGIAGNLIKPAAGLAIYAQAQYLAWVRARARYSFRRCSFLPETASLTVS